LLSGGRVSASAPDKMNDFDLVAITQLRLRPCGATHDLAVEFEGKPLGCEGQSADEIGEREFLGQLAYFPVDLNAQIISSFKAGE